MRTITFSPKSSKQNHASLVFIEDVPNCAQEQEAAWSGSASAWSVVFEFITS